jgi:hypothetical protein
MPNELRVLADECVAAAAKCNDLMLPPDCSKSLRRFLSWSVVLPPDCWQQVLRCPRTPHRRRHCPGPLRSGRRCRTPSRLCNGVAAAGAVPAGAAAAAGVVRAGAQSVPASLLARSSARRSLPVLRSSTPRRRRWSMLRLPRSTPRRLRATGRAEIEMKACRRRAPACFQGGAKRCRARVPQFFNEMEMVR